ncbi:glycosyltransferase [Salinisphaera sp. SPP-AMP-43]|uniref:glycosyltransferase n=1 Tax=Salinisphaera sp. SPP-AMP-43 TaxID=3121288 RepID=UPI003C6E1E6A
MTDSEQRNYAGLRVALIHYWFVSRRGGEKVVDEILRLFPQADVFTHVIDREEFADLAKRHKVTESPIARLPGAKRFYQKLLPLMPTALEQLDLRGYDLVISSESGPAKGVLVDPDTLHVCYCHSPMRYLWDMYHDYRESTGWLNRQLMPMLTHYLRIWDQNSANRVDHFIANSEFVRRRIRKTYRRDAVVIHPPVDVSAFELTSEKSDYFVMLGQLTAYKQPDKAIEAFARMPDKRLVVIGQGEMYEQLSSRGLPNVEFRGHQTAQSVADTLKHARALIFPGVEDFGIVPLEALACGTPVIAYAKGGALETITDQVTGIHYPEPTAESLCTAIKRFEDWEPTIDRQALRQAATAFDSNRFRSALEGVLKSALAEPGM